MRRKIYIVRRKQLIISLGVTSFNVSSLSQIISGTAAISYKSPVLASIIHIYVFVVVFMNHTAIVRSILLP
jgi:hypothetical protein